MTESNCDDRGDGREGEGKMHDTIAPARLDRSVLDDLAEMTGGDLDFLAEMIETFFDEGPKLVAEMQVAAADGNAVALRRASHTLKSNSRTFGATALGDLCQEIEERVAGGKLDGVSDLIARAQAEYPAVVAALQSERPNT